MLQISEINFLASNFRQLSFFTFQAFVKLKFDKIDNKYTDRQIDRQTDRQIDRQIDIDTNSANA